MKLKSIHQITSNSRDLETQTHELNSWSKTRPVQLTFDNDTVGPSRPFLKWLQSTRAQIGNLAETPLPWNAYLFRVLGSSIQRNYEPYQQVEVPCNPSDGSRRNTITQTSPSAACCRQRTCKGGKQPLNRIDLMIPLPCRIMQAISEVSVLVLLRQISSPKDPPVFRDICT